MVSDVELEQLLKAHPVTVDELKAALGSVLWDIYSSILNDAPSDVIQRSVDDHWWQFAAALWMECKLPPTEPASRGPLPQI